MKGVRLKFQDLSHLDIPPATRSEDYDLDPDEVTMPKMTSWAIRKMGEVSDHLGLSSDVILTTPLSQSLVRKDTITEWFHDDYFDNCPSLRMCSITVMNCCT